MQQSLLTDTGLDLDRAWMVVGADGGFLTQRTLPRMALIRPQLGSDDMVLRAPGMLALHVAQGAVEAEAPTTVSVWQDRVPAWDMGAVAAQWFSDFPGQPCRLVRFEAGHAAGRRDQLRHERHRARGRGPDAARGAAGGGRA
nr:MOSC domain-containing protein [Verminephrobacter aporrectodeae]